MSSACWLIASSPSNRAAGVDVAAEAVEDCRAAPCDRADDRRRSPLSTMSSLGRSRRAKRGVSDAEKPGHARANRRADARHSGARPTNGGTARLAGPQQLRDDRTDRRPAAGRLILRRAAGVADERIVGAVRRAVDRPQRHALVHDRGHAAACARRSGCPARWCRSAGTRRESPPGRPSSGRTCPDAAGHRPCRS